VRRDIVYSETADDASYQPDTAINDSSFVYPRVVAVHGDSVLFQLASPSKPRGATDYFVYRARGAARPPSLSLLKQYAIKTSSPRNHMVDWKAIGILRRGKHAYAVAELSTTGDLPVAFELCVLLSETTGAHHTPDPPAMERKSESVRWAK